MELPFCHWKDLAGNAYPARIVAALAAFMLANVVPREQGTPECPMRLDADEDADAESDDDTTLATPPMKKAKP